MLLDGVDLLEDLLEVLVTRKVDGELDRATTEPDLNTATANSAPSFHCGHELFQKLVYGEGLKSHDETTFQIFISQCLKLIILENNSKRHSVLVRLSVEGLR